MESRSTQASGNHTLQVCAACGLAEGIAADFKHLASLARDHVDGEHPTDVLIAQQLPTHPICTHAGMLHECKHAAHVLPHTAQQSMSAPTHSNQSTAAAAAAAAAAVAPPLRRCVLIPNGWQTAAAGWGW